MYLTEQEEKELVALVGVEKYKEHLQKRLNSMINNRMLVDLVASWDSDAKWFNTNTLLTELGMDHIEFANCDDCERDCDACRGQYCPEFVEFNFDGGRR